MTNSNDTSMSSLWYQQWQLMRQNSWLIALLTWVPLAGFMLLWWIFSAGLATKLPIAVIDLDHSQMSRSLISYYDASPTLSVQSVESEPKARALMRQADVYALVIIPHSLEKHARLGQAPNVVAYYNAQFMVAGKLISSALQKSQGTFNAQQSVASALSKGDIKLSQAKASALPIQNQTTALFNSNNNYAQFIVSAALPAFWQVLIMAVMVIALGSELKNDSLKSWLMTNPCQKITVKLLFFGSLLFVHGGLFCYLMYGYFGWPMRGSWSLLLLALLLCLIASQALCVLFMLLFNDMARAMSFAGALAAPSFAFMGISFPVGDMSWFAQFWRSIIPITHYIEVQIAQANYGAPIAQSIPSIMKLLVFFVLFVSITLLVKNMLKNKELESEVGQ